jgi:hypothetical protein
MFRSEGKSATEGDLIGGDQNKKLLTRKSTKFGSEFSPWRQNQFEPRSAAQTIQEDGKRSQSVKMSERMPHRYQSTHNFGTWIAISPAWLKEMNEMEKQKRARELEELMRVKHADLYMREPMMRTIQPVWNLNHLT